MNVDIVRRPLFNSDLLGITHVVARPHAAVIDDIEEKDANFVVLPLTGLFAKHDGPRSHVIGTPRHAVFIAARTPYRLSYPGGIGDRCFTLSFSDATRECLLSVAGSPTSRRSTPLPTHALLPPDLLIARGCLLRNLMSGQVDPIEIEESAITLLVSVLRVTVPGGRHVAGTGSNRNRRQIETVKEAIAVHPEHKWNLAELSRLVNVSPFHLAHTFKAIAGEPVHRYVTRARLAKSLDAVLDTNQDFTSVALETGFASHSHFSARFRAFFGSTPNALRHGRMSKRLAESQQERDSVSACRQLLWPSVNEAGETACKAQTYQRRQ
jgi:AraC-like DNA-binding protein